MLNRSGPSRLPTRDGNSIDFKCRGMAVQMNVIKVPSEFSNCRPLVFERSG